MVMLRVGMVGVGRMGSNMALNIAKAGFPLSLYDAEEGLTQELRDSWAKAGELPTGPGGLCTPNLKSYSSAADVMLASDVCLMCVHTEQQTIDALAGDDGILTVGKKEMTDKVVVDHGTSSPQFAKKMAEAVSQAGGAFLDAPISGGPEGARNGTLSIMIGGRKQHVNTCMPLFEAMGSTIEHMGEEGAGAAAKLMNQHLVITNTVAACEAYVLARSFGLRDTSQLKRLLAHSWGHSRMLDKTLGELMKAEENDEGAESLRRAVAPLRTLAKDAAIITRAARETGAPIKLLDAANCQIKATMKKGFSDCAFAAMASVMEGQCARTTEDDEVVKKVAAS